MTSVLNADLSKPTCRVCLQNNSKEDMSSIFDMDADFFDLAIYEKIEQCAGIEVLRHENMPNLICDECFGSLKVSYKFRTVCRNSNEYLKQYVALVSENPIIETAVEQNPLSVSGKLGKKEASKSQYKTRLRGKIRPIREAIKSEHASPSHSTNSEEFISINFDDVNDEDWCEIDYKNDDDMSGGENDDAFVEKLDDIDIKDEITEPMQIEKPIRKRKRNTKVKEKKPRAKHSKTLEISSDGDAVIREKKTRAKREKKEKAPHICEVCGNIYPRRFSLELHMRRHRDEKPFECEICGHAFHSNFQLIRHMRKHTGDRPYKCTYCPRAFGDQSTLIKHERVHRNERPFKCETCGKSFSYTGVLNYHKLIHTGEKPYACELCGKCFPRAHNLRAHLETLQHQSDPRSKILLKNIRKNNEDDSFKLENVKLKT